LEADLAEAPTKAKFRSAFRMLSLSEVFTDAPFIDGLNCRMISAKKCRKKRIVIQ